MNPRSDTDALAWLLAQREAADPNAPLLQHGVRYRVRATLDFLAEQPLVAQNSYRWRARDTWRPPSFAEARPLLPEPRWDGHDDAIACYWWTWEKAFDNLRRPSARPFVSNYIDTAFNGGLFLWDSIFILAFGRYGARAFPFQRTMDNFYANQDDDGFLPRELRPDGTGQFHPHDPASTGPNAVAWCEWNHFLNTGDRDRLACVFPVILAYHRWMRLNRSWPDGSYYACGLSGGADNMDRLPPGYEPHVHHGHLSWIDSTAQAHLSASLLLEMGGVLGRADELDAERAELDPLREWFHTRAWDERIGFPTDVDRRGRPTGVKQVGAFWAMLAGLPDAGQARRMAAHLEDPASFLRHHRVPTLAADQAGYSPEGRYWNGAIWAPTNWMTLKALERYGLDDTAHDIAVNHHEAVVRIWKDTGTVWENYAPDADRPGKPAKPDFVGWTGLPPIAVLLEHRFGLRPDVPNRVLVWDVRPTESFGVRRYPFGDAVLDLACEARQSADEKPRVTLRSDAPLILDLRWRGGRERVIHNPTD